MTTDFSQFACDNCGACCETLIVEAYHYDAMREPQLYEIGSVDLRQLKEGEQCIMLYDKDTKACPFLDGETKLCGIYPTRPFACVTVEPGDAKCQQARRMKDLPLLRDADGNEPGRELLEESCEEYGLDLCEVLHD